MNSVEKPNRTFKVNTREYIHTSIYSSRWVDFELSVSNQFKNVFCFHIIFYIIINPSIQIKSTLIDYKVK